eukprot:TRINITY_DN3926_c0_g1_i3.p1 TRINITY_DN3926_c0_g1~~TRINITY_DN3926_c0_g1_i3.p1  ORF type:complete len:710 (-),score=130.09 TRINITY_DN3926_c0_g1_i3:929-3058(-)
MKTSTCATVRRPSLSDHVPPEREQVSMTSSAKRRSRLRKNAILKSKENTSALLATIWDTESLDYTSGWEFLDTEQWFPPPGVWLPFDLPVSVDKSEAVVECVLRELDANTAVCNSFGSEHPVYAHNAFAMTSNNQSDQVVKKQFDWKFSAEPSFHDCSQDNDFEQCSSIKDESNQSGEGPHQFWQQLVEATFNEDLQMENNAVSETAVGNNAFLQHERQKEDCSAISEHEEDASKVDNDADVDVDKDVDVNNDVDNDVDKDVDVDNAVSRHQDSTVSEHGEDYNAVSDHVAEDSAVTKSEVADSSTFSEQGEEDCCAFSERGKKDNDDKIRKIEDEGDQEVSVDNLNHSDVNDNDESQRNASAIGFNLAGTVNLDSSSADTLLSKGAGVQDLGSGNAEAVWTDCADTADWNRHSEDSFQNNDITENKDGILVKKNSDKQACGTSDLEQVDADQWDEMMTNFVNQKQRSASNEQDGRLCWCTCLFWIGRQISQWIQDDTFFNLELLSKSTLDLKALEGDWLELGMLEDISGTLSSTTYPTAKQITLTKAANYEKIAARVEVDGQKMILRFGTKIATSHSGMDFETGWTLYTLQDGSGSKAVEGWNLIKASDVCLVWQNCKRGNFTIWGRSAVPHTSEPSEELDEISSHEDDFKCKVIEKKSKVQYSAVNYQRQVKTRKKHACQRSRSQKHKRHSADSKQRTAEVAKQNNK